VTYNEGGIRGVYEVHAIQTAPLKMAVFFRDITERKRAEEERLEMGRRMLHAQKLESLGVMAGGIAHDFNNLLTAIMGNINLALMDVSKTDPIRRCLDEAEKATHHAADLVRQILAYSGKAPFPVRSLDLRETIEEMLPMLQVSISKRVSLNCALGEDVPSVEADPAQIRQVVMNLVINASEAVGDLDGVIRLSTGSSESTATEADDLWVEEPATVGRCALIQVADSGCGIQPEDLGRLFDPFYTTKFAGRGLGLAAVLGVVRGYGGGIRVACRPGKGARFTVVLPIARRPADKAGRGPEAPEPSTRGAGLILLVDDEEAIRSIGRRVLERMGFDVLTASDGLEAVDVFRSRGTSIDCVLMDLTMPRMDGAAAFREIQKLRPDARVLLCSGYSENELSLRFAGLGLSGFVQKPYTPTALRTALGRVLA
jgi:signal transduction histidine kinase